MAAGAHGGRSLASQEATQRGPATPPPFPEASRWPRGCRAASGHNRTPTCLPASQTRWATLAKATSTKGRHHGRARGLKTELQSCSALGHPVALCPHAREGTGPSHIPSQKRGPESRRPSARSQAPSPGPAQDPWSVSSATFLCPDPSLFPLRVSASAGKTSSSLNPPLSWRLTLCFSLNSTNHALGLSRCLQDRRKTKQTF